MVDSVTLFVLHNLVLSRTVRCTHNPFTSCETPFNNFIIFAGGRMPFEESLSRDLFTLEGTPLSFAFIE